MNNYLVFNLEIKGKALSVLLEKGKKVNGFQHELPDDWYNVVASNIMEERKAWIIVSLPQLPQEEEGKGEKARSLLYALEGMENVEFFVLSGRDLIPKAEEAFGDFLCGPAL
ncbi:MAG: hypothetical protein KKA64_02715 [Nanoarchaeota archaeon]|nr:hypothetical protein [Nanoarchaeota archaeon]